MNTSYIPRISLPKQRLLKLTLIAGVLIFSASFLVFRASAADLPIHSQSSGGGMTKGTIEERRPPRPEPIVLLGWEGEYFGNKDLLGFPRLIRNDSSINFDWLEGSPDPSLSSDLFSVRWSRSLDFQEGDYIFKIETDDGMRVWLDEELILDHWQLQMPTYYESLPISLEEGSHDLKVEYFENTGTAIARFWWEKQEVGPSSIPIVIKARGTLAKGEWPEMRLLMGGQTMRVFKVASQEFKDFVYYYNQEISYPLKIEVVFTNDAYVSKTEDRNLYVDYIKVGEETWQAEDSSRVVYDRGFPWDWQKSAFDNQDVLEARENLLWTGSLRFIVFPPGEETPIVIKARGTPFQSGWPEMQLRINDQPMRTFVVSSLNFKDFFYTLRSEIDYPAKIEIVFTNDAYLSLDEDRNLYVDYVKIGEEIVQAEDSSRVVYDRGFPWDWQRSAFDNQDVIPGQEEMLWTGSLRFLLDITVQ